MTPLNKLVKEKNICSLPWVMSEIHLHRHWTSPCCKFDEPLGTLRNEEFPVIWFGEKYKNLRQRMLNEETIDACKNCYIGEGVFSYKTKKNRDLYRFLGDVDVDNPELPKVFNIQLKNICNLACRMCGPNQSSKLSQFISKSSELKSYFPALVADNSVDPKKLKGSFANTMFVTFAGGEPMVDEDCLEILKMIKEESTNLKEIVFITNFTKLNTDILDFVNALNISVILAVSIDGPPHLQEYIRHYSKWDDIFNNMKYVREHYPRIKFGTNSTLSILNVGYVAETVKFVHKLEEELRVRFQYCNPSLVTDRTFLFPGNLPDDVKKLYIDRIDSFRGRLNIPNADQLLKSARGLLNESPRDKFETFIDFITKFDKAAGTDFKLIYPELGADGEI